MSSRNVYLKLTRTFAIPCALPALLILLSGNQLEAKDPPLKLKLLPVAARLQQAVTPVEREPLEKDLPEQKVENPLKGLLNRVFGNPRRNNPRPNAPAVPGATTEESSSRNSQSQRDYIDRNAPHNPSLEKQLAKIDRQIELGSHKVAFEMLQQMMELPNDRVSLGPGESRLIRDEINRLIGSLPAQQQELYRLQFGAIAEQLWIEARNAGNARQIAEVATRYYHTPAGTLAAEHLVSLHIDRGEWALAADWVKRLQAGKPKDRSPAWYFKAAYTFKKAGLPESANEMLVELRGLQSLKLGGGNVDPKLWLETSIDSTQFVAQQITDWRMLYGNPERNAVMQGEAPVLVPQWSIPTSESRKVIDQIEELVVDLRDGGTSVLPVSLPLVVGQYAAFRTLSGVQIVELQTGTPLWETRQGHSPERLITGQLQLQPDFLGSGKENISSQVTEYRGADPQTHPLTGLLFRDATHGLISSDGRQLFVLEDQAWLSRYQPGYYSQNNSYAENDPLNRDWNSNCLVAYDLATGRLEWEIGGESRQEQFELPLAGYYFFGAPLVDGHELYVVGEKENTLKLFCLDANTGHPHWETLIGYSSHAPDRDLGRRWWSAQPAIADGVIVCPNTCGWIVGIDRNTHTVMWEYRYSRPERQPERSHNQRNDREGLVDSKPPEEEWQFSAPMIVGSRILFGSLEQDNLICLNLVTGEKEWEQARGESLALLHANTTQGVLLTETGLKAISLENGNALWSADIPEKDARPCGLPAITNTEIVLPISDGTLCRFSLRDGELLSQQKLLPDSEPLGNLVFHAGKLLSLGPLGAVAFDLKTPFDAELASRMGENPRDPWALLQQAQVAMVEQNWQAALEKLDAIEPANLKPADRVRYRDVISQALFAVVRENPLEEDNRFEQLADYTTDQRDQIAYWQLATDRLIARGEILNAFDEYLRLAETQDLNRLVSLETHKNLRVRFGLWLAGRIRDLRQGADETVRKQLDAKIEALVANLDFSDLAERQRLLELFRGHTALEPIYRQLATHAIEQQQLAESEYYLSLLARSEVTQTAIDAEIMRADLYYRLNRTTAARDVLEKLQHRYQNSALHRQSLALILAEKKEDWSQREQEQQPRVDWGDFDLKMETTSLNYQIMQQYRYRMEVEKLPYLDDMRFDYNRNSQRLHVSNIGSRERHWSVPLRQANHIYNRQVGIIDSVGHLLVVLQSNDVSVLSPVEKRALWSRPLKSRVVLSANNHTYSNGSSLPPLQSAKDLLNTSGVVQKAKSSPLVRITPEYLCIKSERDVQVFDTLTGDLLWTIEKLPAQCTAIAAGDDLFLLDTDSTGNMLSLRLADASPFESKISAEMLQNTLTILNDELIVFRFETKRNLFKTWTVGFIEGRNRKTGEMTWNNALLSGAQMALAGDQLLELMPQSRRLNLFSLNGNGRGKNPTTELKIVVSPNPQGNFAITTADRIYLILNDTSGGSSFRNYYLSSIYVNGTILAIDRPSGELLWKKKLNTQYLLLEMVDDSPVLVFAARRSLRKGNVWRSELNVQVLDKRDGRELLDYTGLNSSDLQAINLDHQEQKLSLMSYNSRMILQAVPRRNQPLEAPRPAQVPIETSAAPTP